MTSMHEILEGRSEIFDQLSRQFAVLQTTKTDGAFNGKVLQIGGNDVIDLTGMDCLALGSSPEAKQSLQRAIIEHDVSCPASAVVTQMKECAQAERALGQWIFPEAKRPDSLLFFLGYDANESFLYGIGVGLCGGILTAFRKDLKRLGARSISTVFVQDRHLHYSGQAGINRAVSECPKQCFRYIYKDEGHLEDVLKKAREEHGENALLVVATDSVLSTTGQSYNMELVIQTAARYDALLYVDEAHAGGAVGPQGRGVTSMAPSFDAEQRRIIIMETLGKAPCLLGGFIAFADGSLKRLFEWMCPHRVFSATPSPYLCKAICDRVELLKSAWGDDRRAQLEEVVIYTKQLFTKGGFELLGNHHLRALWIKPETARQVREFLANEGYLVSIFEAPAVPRGKALLRFGLRADLNAQEIDDFFSAVTEARRQFNFC